MADPGDGGGLSNSDFRALVAATPRRGDGATPARGKPRAPKPRPPRPAGGDKCKEGGGSKYR